MKLLAMSHAILNLTRSSPTLLRLRMPNFSPIVPLCERRITPMLVLFSSIGNRASECNACERG